MIDIGSLGNQEYVYRVDIYQVFTLDQRTYTEHIKGVPRAERERLETPVLLETRFYSDAGTARNYGSYRTGRSKWYNNLGKPTTEWVRVNSVTGALLSRDDYTNYKWEKRDLPQPYESDLDYKVFKVKVDSTLTEVREIPQLKKLSD